MGTHPIFESDFDCLTDKGDTDFGSNMSSVLDAIADSPTPPPTQENEDNEMEVEENGLKTEKPDEPVAEEPTARVNGAKENGAERNHQKSKIKWKKKHQMRIQKSQKNRA